MGDSESAQPPSKKRGALKQLSRENPDDDDDDVDTSEFESGTFKKASDEVLASRRIVKIKRKEPSASAGATTNPFAGIQLLPTATAPAESKLAPAEAVVEDNQKGTDTEEDGDEVESKKVDAAVKDSAEEETNERGKTSDDQTTHDVKESAEEETKDDDDERGKTSETEYVDKTVQGTDQTEKEPACDQTEEGKEKESDGSVEAAAADKNGDNNGSMTSFQQHSTSKNAFTGLATTDSSAPKFSFGDGSTGSPFGLGLSSSNNPSLFGASITKKSEGTGFPSKEEVSVETGEENENAAFSADSIMFEYLDGGWRERGKGEVKVNVSSNGGKARLVMRAKGNYRLILNASLYPEMKLASMDKKGITFACVNSVSEGKEGLSTFALKFKDPTIVEEFRVAVDKHKGSKPIETAPPLKTPENSPTATTEAA